MGDGHSYEVSMAMTLNKRTPDGDVQVRLREDIRKDNYKLALKTKQKGLKLLLAYSN